MRKIIRASVFALALCAPALAGDIPNPSVVEPTRGVMAGAQAAGGYMQNESAGGLAETLLSALESMLALL